MAPFLKGIHKKSLQKVALKKISLDRDYEGVPRTCMREIALLKELDHTSIVKLYDVIHSVNRLFLVFDFLDHDLEALMKKLPNSRLPPNYVNFMWQLLRALAYCHTRRVIHRDLKPPNLLVDFDDTIKLADFGLARRNDEEIQEIMGALCSDGQDLAFAMLTYEPHKRITAKMGLSHRYLDGFHLPLPSVKELLDNLDN